MDRKMVERGRESGEVEAAKCHPNFLTSELGIMEGVGGGGWGAGTLLGDGSREVGWT